MAIDDVVERCAVAIAATFYGGSSGLDEMAQSLAEDHAHACLSALRPGDELPGGMVCVPKEATEKMLDRGIMARKQAQSISGVGGQSGDATFRYHFRCELAMWSAMLAAAKEGKDG